ncbi:MAG: hypothetical protein QXQ33_00690 [Nitrososphaerota archaeon]
MQARIPTLLITTLFLLPVLLSLLSLPASATPGSLYVTSPTTVTVDWSTSGDKTLLSVTDNLPSGKKLVIFVLGWDAAVDVAAQGIIKIIKGSNTLVQEEITHLLNSGGMRGKQVMIFAYDSSASGQDEYKLVITVTTAASGTSTLHVQAMVVLLNNDAFFTTGTNTNIAAGATENVATINTNFPSGSKVVVLAYVQFGVTSTTASYRLYAAGAIRITEGGTVVSNTQFQVGTYKNNEPALVALAYFNPNTGSNPTYAVQLYNSLSETSQAWVEIVAFRVDDGAFLDTGSVTLTSGSQVTVGSLSTSLTGEVGVIALAAAERTASTDGTTFNAGDIVLQKDNSASDQIANQRGWYLQRSARSGRSGVLGLFRVDTSVSNPSFQVKMTARAASNGEAKIVAFKVTPPPTHYTISISNIATSSDSISRIASMKRSIYDIMTASDIAVGSRVFAKSVNEIISASDNLFRLGLFVRSPSESAIALTPISRVASFTRLLLDTATSIDMVYKLYGMIIPITDALMAADSVIKTFSITRTLLETSVLTDQVLRTYNAFRYLTENLISIDYLTRLYNIVRPILEVLNAADAINRIASFTRVISEPIISTDFVVRTLGLFRLLTENSVIMENISRSVSFIRILLETNVSLDVLSRTQKLIHVLNEVASVTDSLSRVTTIVITLLHTIFASDEATSSVIGGVTNILVELTETLVTQSDIFMLSSFIREVLEGIEAISLASLDMNVTYGAPFPPPPTPPSIIDPIITFSNSSIFTLIALISTILLILIAMFYWEEERKKEKEKEKKKE